MAKQHRSQRMTDVRNRNHVAKAVAVQRMASVLRSQQINAYEAQDGDEATATLAAIGWQILMGTQTIALVQPIDEQRLRRMHSALRTLQQVCLDGYTWQAQFAPLFDQALGDSLDVLTTYPTYAAAVIPLADHFRELIETHQVQPDTIHGAELYQQLAQAAA